MTASEISFLSFFLHITNTEVSVPGLIMKVGTHGQVRLGEQTCLYTHNHLCPFSDASCLDMDVDNTAAVHCHQVCTQCT